MKDGEERDRVMRAKFLVLTKSPNDSEYIIFFFFFSVHRSSNLSFFQLLPRRANLGYLHMGVTWEMCHTCHNIA